MNRTGQQRLDAIPAAIERRDVFRRRVEAATGNAERLADLMAEAVTMRMDANSLERVGRNGKVTVCVEAVMANHCLIAAKEAYLTARFANTSPEMTDDTVHRGAPKV